MKYLWYGAYLLGFFAFLKLIRYGLLIKGLCGLRYRKKIGEIRPRSDLPEHHGMLCAAREEEVVKLGFEFSHCRLFGDQGGDPDSQHWDLVYFSSSSGSYANILVPPLPDPRYPVCVEFVSVFEDGFSLETANGRLTAIYGEIPNTLMIDANVETVEKQCEVHLAKLEELLTQKTQAVLKPAEYLAKDLEIGNGYIKQLYQWGEIKKVDQDSFRLTVKGLYHQMLHILRYMPRLRKTAKQQTEAQCEFEAPEVPAEAEAEAFVRIRKEREKSKSGIVGKLMAFVASLLVFSLVFGFKLSLLNLCILVAVLLVHELGHYLGMWLFGYRDRQILFIPFVGAATLGTSRQASPFQRVIVSLLGPAPGILLGSCLLLVYWETKNEFIYQCDVLLLILNYLNLLPIVPLDGGRIFELVLFSRLCILKSAFIVLSTLLFLVGAILVRDPVLGCISLFLLIGLSGQLRQNRMAWRFRKIVRDEDLEHSDDVLIPAIFRMLKQEPYSKLPLAIKYRAANDLLEGIGNEPPTFWPTILSLLLYALVICMPVLFALCYFLFFRSSGPV